MKQKVTCLNCDFSGMVENPSEDLDKIYIVCPQCLTYSLHIIKPNERDGGNDSICKQIDDCPKQCTICDFVHICDWKKRNGNDRCYLKIAKGKW